MLEQKLRENRFSRHRGTANLDDMLVQDQLEQLTDCGVATGDIGAQRKAEKGIVGRAYQRCSRFTQRYSVSTVIGSNWTGVGRRNRQEFFSAT